MIDIKINSKIIKVPSSFEEMTITQGKAIYSVLGKVNSISEIGVEKLRLILILLCDKDKDLIAQVPDKGIQEFFTRFNILGPKPGSSIPDVFKVDSHRYTIVDLNDLTVKEYNDLDRLLINSKAPLQFVDEIVRIVIRRVKGGLFFNYPTRKPYKQGKYYGKKILTKIDKKEFERIRKSIPFSIYFMVFFEIVEFRNNLYKSYRIYDDKKEEEQEEDKRVFSRVKDKRPQVFGNYHTLMSLCSTSTELFKWEEQNIHDYFNYLSYVMLGQKVENAKNSVTKNSINN